MEQVQLLPLVLTHQQAHMAQLLFTLSGLQIPTTLAGITKVQLLLPVVVRQPTQQQLLLQLFQLQRH